MQQILREDVGTSKDYFLGRLKSKGKCEGAQCPEGQPPVYREKDRYSNTKRNVARHTDGEE